MASSDETYQTFLNLYVLTQHRSSIQLKYEQAVEGLGRISVEFQRLESRLASGIAFLLDPDDAYLGAIVTAQLSFRVLIDLFAALYHHRFDDPLKDKELAKLLGRCAEAEQRRNQIIHSEWTPDYKTGKDAVRTKYTARKEAIHYLGARVGHPFVPVNCGAIPEQLVESELFGHQRGAFTGAVKDRTGLVEEADGGTMFLDEVDTLPLASQVKLLRFLQDGEFRPLGASKPTRATVRVIAAANTDFERIIHERKFREDLYYRINVLHLALPPLREGKAICACLRIISWRSRRCCSGAPLNH